MRELRALSGMTQEQVSKELNISRQVYSYYETGRRTPDLDTACRIAEYYKVGIERLLHGLDIIPEQAFTSLPKDYQQLLISYQKLQPESQKNVLDYIEFLVQKTSK